MNLNDLFNEEKVRLDPKCWTGKKIGNPKTKMKGGTRVNNCVPAESVEQGVAEEYELAGVGVAYELGRRAYKQGMTIRDNPYSATREARKNDEWAKGLERGKHDANDARHFRSSVREQGVAEGLAQDEAEEDSGWRAEFVNEINYNTFEVKLTNTRSKESANFIVRPVDMVSYGPTLSIETMDVHDLQTGQTESWTNDDPAPDGPIAYAISGLFYDNKQLQQKLQNIINTHDTKGQDMMPGLEKRRRIGQEVDADTYIDSQEKTQAAMAKMKKGVAEKLGDNRPKLGSKRDAGKSIRKWRKSRGLDETGVAEEGERGRGRPIAGDWNPTSGKVGRTEKTPTGIRHHADPSRYGGTEPEHELDTLNKGQVSSMDRALGVKWDRESKRYFSPIKVDMDEGDMDEGWKSALGAAALAGTMAMGAGGAHARVMPDDDPGINRLTGKPIATQQATTDTAPARADAPSGFSKEYLLKAADPDRFGRFLISIEKAQELLKQMNESKPREKEADYGDDYQDMVARMKKLAGLGPLKTVWDPAKRVYRNVPTAVQPKK